MRDFECGIPPACLGSGAKEYLPRTAKGVIPDEARPDGESCSSSLPSPSP